MLQLCLLCLLCLFAGGLPHARKPFQPACAQDFVSAIALHLHLILGAVNVEVRKSYGTFAAAAVRARRNQVHTIQLIRLVIWRRLLLLRRRWRQTRGSSSRLRYLAALNPGCQQARVQILARVGARTLVPKLNAEAFPDLRSLAFFFLTRRFAGGLGGS